MSMEGVVVRLRRRVLAATAVAVLPLMFLVASPAGASEPVEPLSGVGGNSSACWDSIQPPGGVQLYGDPSIVIDLLPGGPVKSLIFSLIKEWTLRESRAGTQVGFDSGGTGHIYTDVCLRLRLQACPLGLCFGPSLTEGFYYSVRQHTAGGCPTVTQVIFTWDADSTFKPGGNVNNCP